MTKYKWAIGSHVKGVKAETAAKALEIIETNGVVTAETVVEAASNPKNPLHPAFEWNDKKAAHSYRKYQASTLIRALVEVNDDNTEVRTFILANNGESLEYMRTRYVVQHQDLLADAIARLQSDLEGLRASIDSVMTLAKSKPAALKKLKKVAKHVSVATMEMGA